MSIADLQAELIRQGILKPETDLLPQQAQAQPELVRGVGVISPPQSYKGHRRANVKPRGWSGRTVGTYCTIGLNGEFVPVLTATGAPTVKVTHTVPSGFSISQIVPASVYRRRKAERQTQTQQHETALDRAIPETATISHGHDYN